MEHFHLAVLSPAGTEGRRATIQALSLVFGVKVLLFIREKLITESSLDVTATVTRTPWKPYCNGNTISKCKAQISAMFQVAKRLLQRWKSPRGLWFAKQRGLPAAVLG